MLSNHFSLKNPYLSLTVLPIGSKIISLKYQDRELVFLPPNEIINKYSPLKDQIFDERVAWGGDICAPSVSACEVKLSDYSFKVSDHGNFWTENFSLEKQGENLLQLRGATKEFTLKVRFLLENNIFKREYEAINNTNFKLPFTFADHLLLPLNKNMQPEDYLRFPGVEKMRAEWSYNNLLGQKNSIVNWPLKRKGIYADKLFGKLEKGQNNKYNLEYRNDYTLSFSSQELPYVGYWQTNGGWNNSYNLGVEFTNTDRDNLAEGVEENTVWWIEAGKSRRWSLDLTVVSS